MIKVRACLAAIMTLALGMGQPAIAQLSQWRIKPYDDQTHKIDTEEAQSTLAKYADCVVSRRHALAQTFVLQTGAKRSPRVGRRVFNSYDDACFANVEDLRMRADDEVMAGALAGALIRRDYPNVADKLSIEMMQKQPSQPLGASELFGRCVAIEDPRDVASLIKSQPNSVEEGRSIDRLRGTLSACLKSGSTLKINRMFLRGYTAIAMYRLATEVAPQSTPVTH